MSYCTRRWLKGDAERNRGHFPIEVSINVTFSDGEDDWNKSHDVVGTVKVRKAGGDYQNLYIKKPEVDDILLNLAPNASDEACKSLVLRTLLSLNDSEFLDLLTDVFSRRHDLKIDCEKANA